MADGQSPSKLCFGCLTLSHRHLSLLLHPSMPWVVGPGAIAPLFPCQHPRVMELISWSGYNRVIAFGQQDCITILNYKDV